MYVYICMYVCVCDIRMATEDSVAERCASLLIQGHYEILREIFRQIKETKEYLEDYASG